jgi:FtsZ-binding cell division protein ZapB
MIHSLQVCCLLLRFIVLELQLKEEVQTLRKTNKELLRERQKLEQENDNLERRLRCVFRCELDSFFTLPLLQV